MSENKRNPWRQKKESGIDFQEYVVMSDEKEELHTRLTNRYKQELFHQKFINEGGIGIEGIFPKNFSCEVISWGMDEKIALLTEACFLEGCRFETNVFYTKESGTGRPLDEKKTPAKNIHIKTMMQSKDVKEDMYVQYRGAVRFSNVWQFIKPISKEGYMVFQADNVESFCVISFVPEQKCKISQDGGQFISTADNRIQVSFPPNAVDQVEEIGFKIHRVDVNCITEQDNSDLHIYEITPSIYTNHRTFNELLDIQLPVHCIPGVSMDKDDYKQEVFKWNDDGSFELTGIEPFVRKGIASFKTKAFSEYIYVTVSRRSSLQHIQYAIEEAKGLKKWCKILFFVGKKENRRMKVILQCVTKDRVPEVCHLRKQYGFNFVPDCISSDLFLAPDKTVITVDVKGKFRLPTGSSIKFPKVSFITSTNDEFTSFQVEMNEVFCGELYGILSLRIHNKVLHEIYYNPDSTMKVPLPHVYVNEVNERNIVNFLTEKGLLKLTKQMNSENISEVCIFMDMILKQIDNIRKQYTSISEQNLALLKTALDQKQEDQKLNCLITALNEAGQKSLAEKVMTLWLTGQDLDRL